MTIVAKFEEHEFRASVERRVSFNRYVLVDVYNLTLDRPFRYHVWVTTGGKRNVFPAGQDVSFHATIMKYKKRNGKYRYGLTDVNNIKIIRR